MSTDTGTEPTIEEEALLLARFRKLRADWRRTVLGILEACLDLQAKHPENKPRLRRKDIH